MICKALSCKQEAIKLKISSLVTNRCGVVSGVRLGVSCSLGSAAFCLVPFLCRSFCKGAISQALDTRQRAYHNLECCGLLEPLLTAGEELPSTLSWATSLKHCPVLCFDHCRTRLRTRRGTLHCAHYGKHRIIIQGNFSGKENVRYVPKPTGTSGDGRACITLVAYAYLPLHVHWLVEIGHSQKCNASRRLLERQLLSSICMPSYSALRLVWSQQHVARTKKCRKL